MRTGAAYASAAATGFATGNAGLGSSAWIRPFVTSADQDLRDGVAGFEADTAGLAGGWDVELGGNSTAGLSLSYAKTDVDGEDAGNTNTDITSIQATLYGDYTTSGMYIEGLVGYANNDVDTSRSISIGTLNRTASGAYDSDQFMAGVGAGIPIKVGSASFLTPHVGFSYTHVSSDSYTETGAGGLNLTVAPEDLTIALGIVGARYHVNMPTGDGILTPEFRGSVMYDLASDKAQSSSTFTGGGAAFTTTGADVASAAYSVGGGLSYTTADGGMSIGADYDAEVKSDFIGHAGRIELKVHF
jgi:outer membrane autotransporter protein